MLDFLPPPRPSTPPPLCATSQRLPHRPFAHDRSCVHTVPCLNILTSSPCRPRSCISTLHTHYAARAPQYTQGVTGATLRHAGKHLHCVRALPHKHTPTLRGHVSAPCTHTRSPPCRVGTEQAIYMLVSCQFCMYTSLLLAHGCKPCANSLPAE
jgi:hypothetical protein